MRASLRISVRAFSGPRLKSERGRFLPSLIVARHNEETGDGEFDFSQTAQLSCFVAGGHELECLGYFSAKHYVLYTGVFDIREFDMDFGERGCLLCRPTQL